VRAAARVGRARRALVTTLLVASLLRALATALALLLGFGILDLLAPLPLAIRGIVAPAAAIGGLLVLALCISRGRHAFQLTRVALYVEERVPALEFALVTALGGAGLGTEALEGVADRAVPEGFLRRPLARVILVALALLLVSLAGWATLPATIRARILTPVAGDVLLASRVGAPAASRLAPLVVRVDPPGYAGRPARMLEDPVTVAGLPGSRIELRGRGANLGALDSLVALLGNQILLERRQQRLLKAVPAAYHAGFNDFMVIADHINFMGTSPLRGEMADGRARFVDLTRAYDPGLQRLLKLAAKKSRMKLWSGVYLALCGPSYETPAEIRAFGRLGADVVGMSTVPEAIVARQCDLRVAGLSCITNLAAGRTRKALSHSDVLATAERVKNSAGRLLKSFANLYGLSQSGTSRKHHDL